LFEIGGDARLRGHAGLIAELSPDARLSNARYWYRRYLEQAGYPRNTVNSYSYDLAILESLAGDRRIDEISRREIALYLDASRNPSTRKRRLTSVAGLYRFLITKAQVIENDPTESFYPDHIPLKTPHPLFIEEQERLLDAAEADGPRAHALIWLLLELGLTRAEALRLRHSHVDLSDPEQPVIYVYYDLPRHRGKERRLAAGSGSADIYRRLVERYGRGDRLFPILPQSVNKLVERVAQAAGIDKPVSPQLLRDTFAVNRAREGATEEELLRLLGLANDARNRASVQRYLKLGEPPLLTRSDGSRNPSSSGEPESESR
jgi:integrase/recombinase XerD